MKMKQYSLEITQRVQHGMLGQDEVGHSVRVVDAEHGAQQLGGDGGLE
jgi:hypothetical protein